MKYFAIFFCLLFSSFALAASAAAPAAASKYKTYRNTTYKFTLQYPADWKVTDGLSNAFRPQLSFAKSTADYKESAEITIFPSELYTSADVMRWFKIIDTPKPYTHEAWKGQRATYNWPDATGVDDRIAIRRSCKPGLTLVAEWDSTSLTNNRAYTAEKIFIPMLNSMKILSGTYDLSHLSLLRKFRTLPLCTAVAKKIPPDKVSAVVQSFMPKDKAAQADLLTKNKDALNEIYVRSSVQLGCQTINSLGDFRY